ncbi:MAG: 1,2-phenylacetyl-CoA epoxidase subunit PaaE [Saprospiraceae bacterium]
MKQFYPLRVADVRRETSDCVSVAFEIPAALKATFAYRAGQYVTVRTQIAGSEVRRSYSLCSSPLDEEWRIAVKAVPQGLFSTFANTELKAGDTLEVMPPDGRFFTDLDPTQPREYVAFAAGSGITPVFSILKTVLLQEPDSHFTLFYGNKGAESVIFREAIEGLKNQFMHRLSVHYFLSREHTGSELFSSRIDGERCRRLSPVFFNPQETDAFFLCGPEEMILSVREALLDMGVPRTHIHLELFGTATHKTTRTTQTEDKGQMTQVSLQLDGNITHFVMTAADNVLDAALRAGVDLPYACKGGVCCTCRAKIESGTVEMDVNYALEPDEVAAGFVLTCQSHPTTDALTVNFDA